MSEAAEEYVRGLAKKKTGPDGKLLSSAELRVLKALAWLHNEYVWCAWPKLRGLATEVDMSPSHCRRTLAGLCERGVLRRYFVVSERWGEATSNEYEFVEMGSFEVSQQTRDVVFKYKRTRAAVHLSLRRGGRKKRTLGEQSDQVQQTARGGTAEFDERSGACDNAEAWLSSDGDQVQPAAAMDVGDPVERVAGGNHGSCGGQPLRLPVELYLELKEEKNPPTPPLGAASGGKSNGNGKSNGQSAHPEQEREAKARATAKANATTSAPLSLVAAREQGGERSVSLGRVSSGRVIPFQPRAQRQRDPERARAALDGEDAALWDQAAAVLMQCGIAPVNGTRRQREAVMAALRMHVEQKRCTVADAGEYAMRQWLEYVRCSHLLWRVVGQQKFFAEGYWNERRPWDWSHAAVREMRGSRTGMANSK